LPFSVKTHLRLLKLRGWPYSGAQDLEGEIEPDWAEMLVLAQDCEMDLDDFIATPFLPGVNEPDPRECVFVAHNSNRTDEPNKQDPDEIKRREAFASRIRSLIWESLQSGASFNGLILIGQVYQFWQKNLRPPTVGEIAQQMRMSRGAFYRRFTPQELYEAYFVAAGELKRALPDPDGFDPVQRANWEAKKRCYNSDYDPFSED
jgi:AraC-like DNA-binding protein